MSRIPVVDLFAGPGGLSEGFSSLSGRVRFEVRLSIEKDPHAHKTLELRTFLRLFGDSFPAEYYSYLSGRVSRDALFLKYPAEAREAARRAWLAELGADSCPQEAVDERIRDVVDRRHPWVLIGGPPCQAYSLVGRSRLKGISQARYEGDHRHFLYRQYLRILASHAPPVFIMENVAGLLSAEVRETRMIGRILQDLKAPRKAMGGSGGAAGKEDLHYQLYSIAPGSSSLLEDGDPGSYIVKAEEFGIPQARHRIFILGVRSDLKAAPGVLRKANEATTVFDAISDLPALRSGLSKVDDSEAAWVEAIRRIGGKGWLRDLDLDSVVRDAVLEASRSPRTGLTRGGEFVPGIPDPCRHSGWFVDKKLHGFCNHASRAHIEDDLARYMYVAAFAGQKGVSPQLSDFPPGLRPNHKNVEAALHGGYFADRFRVQVAGRPSTTVTSHISKDGHYYIHFDLWQCRSLSVREAARLQTFPDNYFFEGPRTEQYKQVGNAVPVLLARQIAEVVADLVEQL